MEELFSWILGSIFELVFMTILTGFGAVICWLVASLLLQKVSLNRIFLNHSGLSMFVGLFSFIGLGCWIA